MRSSSLALLATLLASGCDCSGNLQTMGGPCSNPASRPTVCGQACSGTTPCPTGYYCTTGGTCTADCTVGSPAGCPAPGYCTADGHCLMVDSGPHDAPNADAPVICADVHVGARRVTPNVIMIIDQSSSMNEDFGSGSRWQVLKDALLMQPDGFLFALQDSVRFGLALFSSTSSGDAGEPATGECPMITWADPALHNYDAINTLYAPADVIQDTPTPDTINSILDRLAATPDPSPDPTIFVLATDGEPDTCAVANPQTPEAAMASVMAAHRAFSMGIQTYIIGVGNEVGAAHLQDMANTGIGVTDHPTCTNDASCTAPLVCPTSSHTCNAPFWQPGGDAGLRDALQTIIGGVLSCDLALTGSIQMLDQACQGTVTLIVPGAPDMVLPCDDPNGWRATDQTHIQLQGNACDLLLHTPSVSLDASFPCDIIIF